MNDLKVFKSTEFGELGVLMIEGKEYFPATQCAKVLGYSNPQEAIRMHCKGVRKTLTPSNGGEQSVNYIPEGDLYRLIIRSKLPAADKFERWVFDEVLPEIRRSGTYGQALPNLEEIIAKTATAVVAEVVRQLVPVLTASTHSAGIPPEEIWEEAPRLRRHNLSHCIISRLDADLQYEINEMILSRRYTLEQIKEHLLEYGIRISKSSIHRYMQRLCQV